MTMTTLRIACGLACFMYALQRASAQCIITVAGPISVEGSPAVSQQFAGLGWGIATDGASGWYVSDASGEQHAGR